MSRGLHVEEAGAGHVVVAVPGLGGGAWFFAPLAERLRHAARIIAVDLPGTGRGPALDGVSLARWVADLGDLVRQRVPDPHQVTLLGHSMGTIVALEAWRAWPEHIRSLVLVGGLPQVRQPIRERLTERLAALADAVSLDGWGPKVSPGIFSPATFRERPDVVAAFEARFETQDVELYRRSIRILLDADARGIAAGVTVPTLIVSGGDDQYAPPESILSFAAEFARRPVVEILPNTGHVPFLERPEAVAALVAGFVGGAASGSPA